MISKNEQDQELLYIVIYNNSRELTITTTSNYPLSVWVYSFDFFNCSSNIVRYILQYSSLVALFATIHHLYCITNIHSTVWSRYNIFSSNIFVCHNFIDQFFSTTILIYCCVLVNTLHTSLSFLRCTEYDEEC